MTFNWTKTISDLNAAYKQATIDFIKDNQIDTPEIRHEAVKFANSTAPNLKYKIFDPNAKSVGDYLTKHYGKYKKEIDRLKKLSPTIKRFCAIIDTLTSGLMNSATRGGDLSFAGSESFISGLKLLIETPKQLPKGSANPRDLYFTSSEVLQCINAAHKFSLACKEMVALLPKDCESRKPIIKPYDETELLFTRISTNSWRYTGNIYKNLLFTVTAGDYTNQGIPFRDLSFLEYEHLLVKAWIFRSWPDDKEMQQVKWHEFTNSVNAKVAYNGYLLYDADVKNLTKKLAHIPIDDKRGKRSLQTKLTYAEKQRTEFESMMLEWGIRLDDISIKPKTRSQTTHTKPNLTRHYRTRSNITLNRAVKLTGFCKRTIQNLVKNPKNTKFPGLNVDEYLLIAWALGYKGEKVKKHWANMKNHPTPISQLPQELQDRLGFGK